MLRRELAAARIARAKARNSFGLENVDAHCLSLSDLASGLNAADNRASATPKLIAQGRTGARPRMFVLMTKDQAALLKVVERHLDGHTIANQSLDPVLLHLARRVGHDLAASVELNAIACVGKISITRPSNWMSSSLEIFLSLRIAVFTAARVGVVA
jgi:hypothetical protein